MSERVSSCMSNTTHAAINETACVMIGSMGVNNSRNEGRRILHPLSNVT